MKRAPAFHTHKRCYYEKAHLIHVLYLCLIYIIMNTTKQTNGRAPEKSDVALREEAILQFWKEQDIFNKTLQKDAPKGDFIFYDGPPFATGLPHYGHILAGTIKDAVPRFWTMNGYRVPRKWGWDCHGLPVENLIEKKLGLATKRDIEEHGVQNFNEAARDAVLEYADDWKKIVPRMGRFVDMDDDYKTMDSSYTESVWWVFAQLHKKGLVYEGFKSMHLCPRCGTTLSNFEVNLGYKDIKDIAVTVKLPLVDEPGTSLLVWTTTPWTLPGNMAAAIHKDIVYAKVAVTSEGKKQQVILAKERLEQLGTDDFEILEEFKGEELVGKTYIPPFDYWQKQEFEGKENAWKIYHADYVELGEEGTGAVHLAPAYGEDDMNLAKAHGVPVLHHVDTEGHFMDFVTDFAGQLVKPKDDDAARITHLDADIEVLKALQEARDEHGARLYRKENITHSYPHCWRCQTPLLNYATTSWFIEVTKIKDTLVAENSKTRWVPEHIGVNRFGKWLEGARDWAVSRQRYWGAPLPIWRNEKTKEYKVFMSLAELQEYVPRSGNTYLLMRHGESESNLGHVIQTDINTEDPLTENGKTQVCEQAKALAAEGIDLIVVSPFGRTMETAEIVREELGLREDQVFVDERLQEIQVGSGLQGKRWEDHARLYASFDEQFEKRLDGVDENRRDVQRRTGSLLYELEKKHAGKKILLIGHNSSTFALACVASGAHPEHAPAIKKNFWLGNAQVRPLSFTMMPHNDQYELDFHRPYIDDIELFDQDGTKLERVPDVFDCWFESGSMPYAQQHYPFENTDVFDPEKQKGYPADFISESVDQTRGWFYSLMVLGTALFGKAPFKHVITNGLVLAEDGKKMSKSLQNYPDPIELVDRQGADAMRYYLLSSSIIRGEDLNFSEKEVQEIQRKNIGRLHNVLAMYEMYADGTPASNESTHVLDRWILARLHETADSITEGFKSYELDRATRPVADLIDDLSVWYLRRSRERLKSNDEQDKQATLATLRYTLRTLSLLMAPSMPFYADYLYRAVKEGDDPESVHLAAWPDAETVDTNTLEAMTEIRTLVSLALEARTKAGVKVRQPLQTLRVKHESTPAFEPYLMLLQDEVNVKEIVQDPGMEAQIALDVEITPELKAEGDAREFIRAIQDLRKHKGLQAHDRIALCIQTSKEGEAMIDSFRQEIAKTVGAEHIAFGANDGQEVIAGEHSFTVALEKH